MLPTSAQTIGTQWDALIERGWHRSSTPLSPCGGRGERYGTMGGMGDTTASEAEEQGRQHNEMRGWLNLIDHL